MESTRCELRSSSVSGLEHYGDSSSNAVRAKPEILSGEKFGSRSSESLARVNKLWNIIITAYYFSFIISIIKLVTGYLTKEIGQKKFFLGSLLPADVILKCKN